ncbi:MAG: hypothetical protein JJ855_00350 [Rhodospirillales bacterium]|nr:hypothetical protein [Rhodospirillales bacterium]
MTYEDKFVAFVDILGFSNLVEKSAAEDDPESIRRLIGRLAGRRDIDLYRIDGPEICPGSSKVSNDVGMRISQVSDCVIVSAEISPAGAVNIINYCRKIAERLLLREVALCQGYLTRGKMFHEDMTFFGPGYQAAVAGEKNAAGIVWNGEMLGTPFVEIDRAVISYIEAEGDSCVREMTERITISNGSETYLSPYGVFDRMADWACDPAKSRQEIDGEIRMAENVIDKLEKQLLASKPAGPRAEKKLQICLEELANARIRLADARTMFLR